MKKSLFVCLKCYKSEKPRYILKFTRKKEYPSYLLKLPKSANYTSFHEECKTAV